MDLHNTTVVDHTCPNCGEQLHVQASGLDFMRNANKCHMESVTNWSCPSCGVGFDQTTPFDTDLFRASGFHSWVGDVGGERACIVVSERDDGSEPK